MADDDLGKLVLQIQADLSDVKTQMSSLGSNVSESVDDMTSSFGKLGASWEEVMKGFLGAQAIMAGLKELQKLAIDSTKAYDDEIVSMTRLRASLGDAADAVEALAKAKAESTRYSKDETLAAANMLAQHHLNAEEIKKLIPVIMDYSAKTGKDLVSTTQAFSNAIEYGTTRGLRPYGIEIDKTGSQQQIFNELLKSGQGDVKGMAEQIGQLGLGPMAIFNNQLKEIEEEFGKKIVPYFTAFIKDIGPGILSFLEKAAELASKFAEGWAKIGTFAGYLMGGKGLKEAAEATAEDFAPKAAATGGGTAPATGSQLGTTPLGGKQEKEADIYGANLDAALAVHKAKMEEIKSLNEQMYKAMTEDADTYYGKLFENLYQEYADEKKALELKLQRAERDKDDVNVIKIRGDLTVLESKYQASLTKESEKYAEAIQRAAEARKRISEEVDKGIGGLGGFLEKSGEKAGGPSGIAGVDNLAKLKLEQDQEFAEYQKRYNALAALDIKDKADELKRDRALHDARLAQAKIEQDQEIRLAQAERAAKIDIAATTAQNIQEIAQAMYELTGKKSREAFEIFKAASVAQAVIDTYKSATAAYSGMASAIPGPVGIALGIVAAAASVAMGLANVQKIESQKMAEGGMLRGPRHSAGGIAIEAEGGEYIQPVETVDYYGPRVMEAIRKRVIPRSMFAGMGVMPFTVGDFAQSGGMVSAGYKANTGSVAVHIANINDPRMIDRHLSSSEGRASTLNWMGQNKTAIRKMIGV